MSDLPGSPGVDLDDLYARLGQMGSMADALRSELAGEREDRQNEIRLLERKQLTAQQAIEQSQHAIHRTERTNRLVAVVSVVAIVAALASAFLWVQQRREIDQRQAALTHAAVVNCENANVSRRAILDEFSAFIDVLAAVSPPATTAEVAAARKATVDKLRADFAAATPVALLPRDCSPRAVTAPTTLTPTSIAPGQ